MDGIYSNMIIMYCSSGLLAIMLVFKGYVRMWQSDSCLQVQTLFDTQIQIHKGYVRIWQSDSSPNVHSIWHSKTNPW